MSNPKDWGPSAWHLLHTLSYTYPEKPTLEKQMEIEKFISSFSELLPCKECKEGFKKYLKQNPIHSKTREGFIKWCVDAHNHVNKKLGKDLVSYDEAELLWRKIEPLCKECKEDVIPNFGLKVVKYSFLILAIMAILCYILIKYSFHLKVLAWFFTKSK